MADLNVSLVVAAYGDDASAAAEDFQTIKGVDDAYVVAAVVLTRDSAGKVEVTEHGGGLVASGTTVGAVAGFVVGLFAPPLLLTTVVGAGIGAGVGAIRKRDEEKAIGVDAEEWLNLDGPLEERVYSSTWPLRSPTRRGAGDGQTRGVANVSVAGPVRTVPDMCRALNLKARSRIVLAEPLSRAQCSMHPIELVFLAQHVTGRAAARGDVQLCRWVTPDVAFRMLWPRRAEQLRGVLYAQHPQPVLVQTLRPGRHELGDNRFAQNASSSAGR